MDDNDLSKSIQDTTWEVFPLDRMLPKSTVLNYFLERYHKNDRKADFLKNTPENKRVREGYWSLFACLALDIIEAKEHFLLFPSDPRNDVTFLSEHSSDCIRPKMNWWEWDVKEYESHSVAKGFEVFLRESVNPSRTIYGVIIGVHCDVGTFEVSSLYYDESDRGVLLICSDVQDSDNPMLARVVFVLKKRLIFDQTVDLAKAAGNGEVSGIFHDELRKPLY